MHMTFDPSAGFSTFGGGGLFGYIVLVIGLWPTLEKAGIPGWGAVIPIYNIYLIFKIGGLSLIWMLGLLVPVVNIAILLWVAFRVSDAFGYGILMGLFGLFLFAPIGFLIIGFDSSTYHRPRFDTGNAGTPT